MMKIGIITYWRGTSNYGMLAQHWALQTVLKKIGHNPFLIRYFPDFNNGVLKRWIKEYEIADYVRALLAMLKGDISLITRKVHDNRRGFSSFRKKNIRLSKRKYYSLNALQINPPKADVYITGSDQVWSQLLSDKENEVYFLNFGSEKTRRVSYAPSFSMQSYPADLENKLKDNLSRFNSISCREYSGVKICKDLGINEAVKVLDPTFLLNKEDYLDLIGSRNNLQPSNPYIFIYSLNIKEPEEIRWKELYDFSSNKEFIVTPADGYTVGKEIFGDLVRYSYCTLEEWLSNIFYSSLVVTPSFHGIALSIILEKDFVYTPLAGKRSQGNNRILDLLNDMNLGNRILNSNRSYLDVVSNSIDWDIVRKRLDVEKSNSLNFLKNSIL